ncbi:heat shock 70 kDa protein 12A-like [Dreissena polymorpha]|uniref:Heat shock 70 kDa protein 12A n=1 Tax=Dreissena polymorpha TaxID=45954 RepID=A0A9D4HWC4_DREPO|nr:heat shock 70 kDa protein 12A-like [Dreissena polymorpha]XP_052241001.1 heat shock 70 kDa protein 12A-like [Dreissena polymorpha]XP_052241002.1 heat shock 70 kDa protein 12A-like [Dreissena polymorpha]XP_052241003.1 heat shock 70 kDa protein 12A-like [Dreissena polymorpha]KAH3735128.1 hypothetical protein DPMN_041590 [Dreissena polymorpha]
MGKNSSKTLDTDKKNEGGHLLVAAIDFGTTYSGYAFSFKNQFETDPCNISAKTWAGGQLQSLKAPTCVLIQPDGKTLEAFGYDAETRYSQLCETGEQKNWYFFQRFKMLLWEKEIHKDTMLDDENGKSLPVLTVFSLSIRYMKDDLESMASRQVSAITPEDIHWVLTVPAIWDDASKHFMRLAAQQAGISSEKLSIALEPEVASIYCRHIKIEADEGCGISSFQLGKKYIVLDAGGGTIDITVHEVGIGGQLKELYKASGGAWGGTEVDKGFMDFIANMTGKDIIQHFKEKNIEDYLYLLRDFEIKKRNTDSKSPGLVTIRLPLSLIELVKNKGETIEQILQSSRYANMATVTGDKFRLDVSIFRSFFKKSVDNIVLHLKQLLHEIDTTSIETILMVGGYSESPFLIETIEKKFPRMTVIIPKDPGIAVLKGAVIFGHCPTSITKRVSKYTYGTDVSELFDREKHPLEKLIETDDGDMCVDIFDVFVEAGQSLSVGETQYQYTYHPCYVDQSEVKFELYITTEKDVKYVTDHGCKKVGCVVIPLSGSGLDRGVLVRLYLGGTEIMLEFEEESTRKITRTVVDFLT